MGKQADNTFRYHMAAVKEKKRIFENAFCGVSRMILESDITKVVVNGKTTSDFSIFRTGRKHIIGMYDELNSFVSYVKDAAERGSSSEMAYVLVGEPGNGKIFFVDFLCSRYRQFLTRKQNRKYTFRFNHMDEIGDYGRIKTIESQTYEDPLILAMNLVDNLDENKELLGRKFGFSDTLIETFYQDYRPLGACTGYIWNDIRTKTDGALDTMLDFVEIVPVPLTESLGTVTGIYTASRKKCWTHF